MASSQIIVVRRLHDAMRIVVARREHRARDTSRQTPIQGAQVLIVFALVRETVRSGRQRPCPDRRPAIRRVDDQRGLPCRQDGVARVEPVAPVEAQLATGRSPLRGRGILRVPGHDPLPMGRRHFLIIQVGSSLCGIEAAASAGAVFRRRPSVTVVRSWWQVGSDRTAERAEYNPETMPLYEYACQQCEHEFEALIRAGETPECPSCHGTSLERRLSVFAAHTKSTGAPTAVPAVGACGTCGDPRGPGSCSLN